MKLNTRLSLTITDDCTNMCFINYCSRLFDDYNDVSIWYIHWYVFDTHIDMCLIHTLVCVWYIHWYVSDTYTGMCLLHTLVCVCLFHDYTGMYLFGHYTDVCFLDDYAGMWLISDCPGMCLSDVCTGICIFAPVSGYQHMFHMTALLVSHYTFYMKQIGWYVSDHITIQFIH